MKALRLHNHDGKSKKLIYKEAQAPLLAVGDALVRIRGCARQVFRINPSNFTTGFIMICITTLTVRSWWRTSGLDSDAPTRVQVKNHLSKENKIRYLFNCWANGWCVVWIAQIKSKIQAWTFAARICQKSIFANQEPRWRHLKAEERRVPILPEPDSLIRRAMAMEEDSMKF